MIPQISHRKSFENLDLDKAFSTHRPSRETSKILEGLTKFCSFRQLIAVFYTLVGIIFFTGFILSKDSFDNHRVVFDSVALIQVKLPSTPLSGSEIASSSALSSPDKREQLEEKTQPVNGLIIHHPMLSAHDPVPPSSQKSPAPSSAEKPPSSLTSPSPESSVPESSAIRFRTEESPSWATNISRENFDPSSLDLPEFSVGKTNEHTQNP